MAILKPFRALRPLPEYARQVAALPYDVMGSDEAREMVQGNPYSFLHVDKAEVDLDPSVDLYSEKVYQKAKENLETLVSNGVLAQDAGRCFYIYRLVMNGRSQVGLVACASVEEYENGAIKRHELTRADKEADRIRHVEVLNAHTGPIFLACKPHAALCGLVDSWMASHEAVCDFVAEDGVGHAVWVVDDEGAIKSLEQAAASMEALYIADGHHRCASAAKVAQKRREASPQVAGTGESGYFLAVLFPADQLEILDYNRLVRDLNGLSAEDFLKKLEESFQVTPCGEGEWVKPSARHTFGMYLDGKWYALALKPGICDENNPISRLDVSILQEVLLAPVLGVGDPRTDKRIDFVGGIRGLQELERRVAAGWRVAFSMAPTTMEELMAVADAGLVMPPKSTWFEPKLRSGLFIHKLDD